MSMTEGSERESRVSAPQCSSPWSFRASSLQDLVPAIAKKDEAVAKPAVLPKELYPQEASFAPGSSLRTDEHSFSGRERG